MNRWHVYEFMKRFWYDNGTKPSIIIVDKEFTGMDKAELFEGIMEFEIMVEKHQ